MQSLKSVDALIGDLRKFEIANISADFPLVKLDFAFNFVKHCIELDLEVHYLDFDLILSSLMQNVSYSDYRNLSRGLQIFQPGENSVESSVTSLLGSLAKKEGFIIIDSFNMMQNLIALESSPHDSLVANRKSSVLISLIQQVARNRLNTLVVLSLAKSRPKRMEGDTVVWEKELVGGRMLKLKSDETLLLKLVKEGKDHQESKQEVREILASPLDGVSEPYRILSQKW